MQSFQIDGTFTYSDNVKTLKLGDNIKLIKNENNRINTEAVGAYTKGGKKIGYIPFKSSQIDLKANYTVTKINLTKNYPQILISREFAVSNIIEIKPKLEEKLQINPEYSELPELKEFSRFLKRNNNDILNIGITWKDDNYIDLIIHTSNNINIYYTVTKKYYEDHIFQYDELYSFELIPKSIYIPFQIHRLEEYIKINYKPLEKIIKSKVYQKKLDLFFCGNTFDNIMDDTNFQKIDKIFGKETSLEEIKYAIQYKISDNNYYKEFNMDINIDEFKSIIPELQLGGIAYNHMMKAYCNIDLYNDDMILEIITDKIDEKIIHMIIIKCIIANKNIVCIFNPIKGIIYKYNITDIIKNNILEIITKTKK